MRVSLIDFATKHEGQSTAQAIATSRQMAQWAEEHGVFERIWYTEHHNMPGIVSSSPAVLIAHIAAHTSTIRLGSGGVMLPNHAPLVIAEQFGILAEAHPGRIDLGLGRAPGTDQVTLQALRRDPSSANSFPQDVLELRGYFSDGPLPAGVHAYPGRGTKVPLYMLGSSLFGAQLAAQLGLPYSFASHFAPGALLPAVAAYREQFVPSEQQPEPYVIAAVNALAAPSLAEAQERFDLLLRRRIRMLVDQNPALRGRSITDEELETLVRSPIGEQARTMLTYSAVGTAAEIGPYLEEFAQHSGADEVMVAPSGLDADGQLETLDAVAASR